MHQVKDMVGVGDLRRPEGLSVALMISFVEESLEFCTVSVPGNIWKDLVGLIKPGERKECRSARRICQPTLHHADSGVATLRNDGQL